MNFIQNYNDLAKSDERIILLDLIETAYSSIDTNNILTKSFNLNGDILRIQNEEIKLSEIENIYLLGFGKGSAEKCAFIENILGDKLTKGFVIDVESANFSKIEFTKGTHPLPSQVNFDFTKKVISELKKSTAKDVVLVVTCGGGSAMLVQPRKLSIDELIQTNEALLKSGANITEMNIIRKHLSDVKGGGLEAALHPSKLYDLIFSDVPGNDYSVIASGPTVMDKSTLEDAKKIFEKYDLGKNSLIKLEDMEETAKDESIFSDVKNILMLSNKTALDAMEEKAKALGKKVKVYSDIFQNEAKTAGKKLIGACEQGSILLAGGETTVKVTGKGQGGRNQEVVLGALKELGSDVTISSFATDGWDNVEVAGAIGDSLTLKKAQEAGIDPNNYLIDNDSLAFFKTVGDAIVTGRLPTNVSDLMIVIKK